ncbi:MAG: hypothetical protein ABL891_03140 [Burkholderiales bacterium]
MEKTIYSKESSMMYRKIDALALSNLDREEAFAALEASDRLANGIYWVFEKFGRISGWLSSAPNLKHQ